MKERFFYQLYSMIFAASLVALSGCQQTSKGGTSDSAASVFDTIVHPDDSHLSATLDLADAIHLERRVGIGSPKYRVDRLVGRSRAEAIDIVLADLDSPHRVISESPEWLALPNITFLDNSWRYCHRKSIQARIGDVETRWMNNLLTSQTPAHERLILLFSNIFVSDYKTYRSPETYARHHQIIREHATGNMRDFLSAILKDPAVLVYLNNDVNTRANINENLAREYLELFTLGEGNYTEQDIRNLAYVFAGESVNPISQDYQQFRSAKSSLKRSVLGRDIKTPSEAVDLVLDQPAHARFMANKFYKTYVSLETPSVGTIEQIAGAYFKSNFEVSELLRATLATPEFWSDTNRFGLIKDPVDIVFGTLRTLGYDDGSEMDARDFRAFFTRMNYSLIDPPNVAGYPGGMSWVDGGLFNTRKQVLDRLVLQDRFNFDFIDSRSRFKRYQANELEKLRSYFEDLNQMKAQAHPEQLIIEAAFFDYVSEDMIKNRHPGISIKLVGVHLGERSWPGMKIKLGLNRKHNYPRVEVYENSCSPECISNFNKGWDSDWHGIRGFDVNPFNAGGPTQWLNERWGSISSEDRLLLQRLFQLVHFIPDGLGNGRAFWRGSSENQNAWREWLEKQQSIAAFDDLKDATGKVFPPVVLIEKNGETGRLCGSVLASGAYNEWSRPIDGVSDQLSVKVNRTDEWISKQVPNNFLGPGASALERLVLSDGFQLK
jgi:hypothetical protein